MEKKMETTIMGFIGYRMGLYWDNGKENGNYYSILGFRVWDGLYRNYYDYCKVPFLHSERTKGKRIWMERLAQGDWAETFLLAFC